MQQIQENERERVAVAGLSNREMAAIFFNIARVLREEGNVNPWRTEAYERGARALMGYRSDVRNVLAEQKVVPFRRRQHIGKRLQAKIREMAQSGELAQYREMLTHLPPHRQELMQLPGIGPSTADRLQKTLGITTAVQLVRAARAGQLHSVKGFGPRRIAALAAVALPGAEPPNLFSL